MTIDKKIKVIIILGTNASGKSGIGLNLAQKYNGEIISADSRQIYRNFDLCSGKVTAEEIKQVPHHLIDIIDIGTKFSVADYQKCVYEIVPQITNRQHLPFIVGGTGLYLDSVTQGYVLSFDEEDQNYKEYLYTLSNDELWELLSPKAMNYLSENPSDSKNRRRIIRILEKEHSGLPLYPQNTPRYDVLQIGVTWDKEQLHTRIMERLCLRIEQGMLDEVGDYLRNGGNPAYLESLGLEYKHILWLFQGKYATIDEFKIGMAQAIRRFAKKQMTWFKRDKTIKWLDMTNNYISEASILIDRFLLT
jgi:tRNA dimethylallyltransferase